MEELKKLEELYSSGFIQDDEYNKKKGEILNNFNNCNTSNVNNLASNFIGYNEEFGTDLDDEFFSNSIKFEEKAKLKLPNYVYYYMVFKNDPLSDEEENIEEEEDFSLDPTEASVPKSYRFDYTELVSMGKVPPYGEIVTFRVSSPEDLEATVMKSDSATLSIKEIDFENAPGLARFAKLEDLLNEGRMNLEQNLSLFSGPIRQKYEILLEKMHQLESGNIPFDLQLDDPLANSYIIGNRSKIKNFRYERSWEQDKEYGLLFDEEKKDNIYSLDDGAEIIVQLFTSASKIVAFTGAGISTESGVPAYRTPGSTTNIWDKYNPQDSYISNFLNSSESRKKAWQMYAEFYNIVKDAKPNPSHQIFDVLYKKGKLLSIITQNIDNLHVNAGVPPEKVIELHGSISNTKCMSCQNLVPSSPILERVYQGKETLPQCSLCGGILKPNTISFGEALLPNTLQQANQVAKECDLFIVMGSSLVVQPANRIPGVALKKNVPLIILNKGETMYDKYATVCIDDACGKVMQRVMDKLN